MNLNMKFKDSRKPKGRYILRNGTLVYQEITFLRRKPFANL